MYNDFRPKYVRVITRIWRAFSNFFAACVAAISTVVAAICVAFVALVSLVASLAWYVVMIAVPFFLLYAIYYFVTRVM